MVKEELEEVIDVATEDSDCLPCCTEENFSKKNISSSCSNSNNKSMAFEKKKVDEIDLTVSDSDDEPLIWCKRRELSLKKSEYFQCFYNVYKKCFKFFRTNVLFVILLIL